MVVKSNYTFIIKNFKRHAVKAVINNDVTKDDNDSMIFTEYKPLKQ